MKRKKELIIVLSSLLVIVLSVSVAYFTTKILGTEKDISVTSADLKVIFTSGSGTINGSNIEPGWTSGENTFTVKNESNVAYNYNIIIKDLINTFVTTGFLQYKITSTDGGFNMTDFADVPKSGTATDKVLAENISIAKGAIHTYTIEFKYLESTEIDQSADMGKMLSGKIFIEKSAPTITEKLLENNPKISVRDDFYNAFTTNTINTLYKTTENGTDVYYFAGMDFTPAHCDYNGGFVFYFDGSNVLLAQNETQCLSNTICKVEDTYAIGESLTEDFCTSNGGEWLNVNATWKELLNKQINNWVKFGKYQNDYIKYRGYYSSTNNSYKEYSTMEECTSASNHNYNCTAYKYASTGDDIYWRIIRTNADGSVRLLYSGISPDTTEGHIGKSAFNTNYDSPKYVGYMYGDDDSTLDGIRANTNDSTIKTYIDNWYENNLTTYTNYLSNDAVYCNDRELGSGSTYSTSYIYSFKSKERINAHQAPTYDCINNKDAFSGNNEEAKLKYPIALMTISEANFIGDNQEDIDSSSLMWNGTNASLGNIVDNTLQPFWWTMSPLSFNRAAANFYDSGYLIFDDDGMFEYQLNVRPVTSLKSCVQWKSGNGSADNPYEIEMNGGC